MKLFLTCVLALVLHLTLGWAWTLLAGVGGGFWKGRGGWRVGALGVGSAWMLLVVYNFVVAPHETARMVETVGGIIGNMPGAVVVGGTLLIGVLVGLLGGFLGTQLALLVRRTPCAAAV